MDTLKTEVMARFFSSVFMIEKKGNIPPVNVPVIDKTSNIHYWKKI